MRAGACWAPVGDEDVVEDRGRARRVAHEAGEPDSHVHPRHLRRRAAPPPPKCASRAPRAPAPHPHIARAARPRPTHTHRPRRSAAAWAGRGSGGGEGVCVRGEVGGWAGRRNPTRLQRAHTKTAKCRAAGADAAGGGGRRGSNVLLVLVFFACSGKGGAPRSRTDRGCTRRRAAGNGGSVSAAPRAGGGGGRRGHCKLVRRGAARRARARECARERALVAGIRAHLLFGGLGDGDEHERIYGGAEAVFFGSIYGSI